MFCFAFLRTYVSIWLYVRADMLRLNCLFRDSLSSIIALFSFQIG